MSGSMRQWLQLLQVATPGECRELGNLLLALADVPRDGARTMMIQSAIDALPPPPADGLAAQIAEARARVIAANDRERAVVLDENGMGAEHASA